MERRMLPGRVRARRAAAALLALALAAAVAACGGDDDDDAGGDAPTEGTTGGDAEDLTLTLAHPERGELTFDALAAGDPDAAREGRLVLLLHGFPETDEAYREFLPDLADAGYYAVAFNQRGYSPGARPDEVEAYNIVELVGDVTGVADELGADSFHLVGHDWGGAVAWVTAVLDPDRVTTLTALSTPHPDAMNDAIADPEHPQSAASGYMETFRAEGSEDGFLTDGAESFEATFGGGGGIPEDKVAAYAEVLATPEALGAALDWYRANPLPSPARIGATTVPTLYMWGTEDIAFARETAEATADLVDAPYTFRELEGQGHWLPETAAPDVLADLLPHLESADPTG
jgi:pimeloyl-ACP methyl ester carboxylesterase